MGVKIKHFQNSFSVVLILSLSRCATAPSLLINEEVKTIPIESNEIQKRVSELSEKIQLLETKLMSMNEKLDSARIDLNHLKAEKPIIHPEAPEIIEIASRNSGVPIEPKPEPDDPEIGFTNDSSVQNFRKAMIYLLSQKYQEATLAFSSFLETSPDHPLAGPAQFYIGQSYFKQKEYKLALQEYYRVLKSYDRSNIIPDTLYQIIKTEQALKQLEEAEKHKLLLTSLFPLSPAAHESLNLEKSESPLTHFSQDSIQSPPQVDPKPLIPSPPTADLTP